MTEFGGEWIQAFPKDSWANVTNEYEPYTFNDYGSKIPLQEFRPTTVQPASATHDKRARWKAGGKKRRRQHVVAREYSRL